MISVEMEDVLAVLQLCKPYIIGIAAALVIGIVIMIACRRMSRDKRFLIRGEAVIAMVLAVVVCVNMICFGPMATLIGLATGNGTLSDETNEEAAEVAEEIMEDGIVLLKNESLLPLNETKKLNIFGWESINPAYGGAGSGGINDLYDIVSLNQGLENAGFSINQKLVDFYNNYGADDPEMSIQKQSWTLPEPPVDTYSDELIKSAKEYSDVAVVVLSRKAGEGHNDIPMDVKKAAYDNNSDEYDDFPEGEHYLQLSQTERDMVDMVCSNFDNVIVIYNGANQFELGFADEYPQIKSVVWCPGTGNVGFNALGKVFSGEVNPSGKTPDTFIYDMTTAPWWDNAEKTEYTNLADMAVEGMNAGTAQVYAPAFTNYVEGIYVGYKYYETAAQEGAIDYDKTVQYPFGYGLSYTEFEQKMGELEEKDGQISVDVEVTNTGDVAGKDVVEVYYNPPYTNGGIEKSSANLIEFAKTDLLQPGKSQIVTVTFSIEDMASYDENNAKAYVLEKGDYVISINSDSHTVLDQKTYTADADVVYKGENKRASDDTAAGNVFEDAKGDITYLSRADHFANYEEATAAPASAELSEPYVSEYHLNSNFDKTTYLNDEDVMPTTGADNGLTLEDMRDADYDDPRWEKLLDQLSVDEMANMIAMAGYQTAAMDSVGKVATLDFDGPAAINNNFTGVGSIGFPIEVVIASTWNKELAQTWGECMGKISQEMGAEGWYAPGMNTHRTAFGARNYEYFSEDGVLAGNMGAKAVEGARKYGVYSYIKHFAMYEGNAKMVSVWSNEQAIREIYLKPFEISVKQGGANAVMVSWSFLGDKWTGECSNLMNTVLRDEWGFRGMALTDFFRNNGHGFMNADAALANGVDVMLSTFNGEENNVANPEHPTSVLQMRNACKNVMYTVVSSWAYDGEHEETGMENWKKAGIGIDTVIALFMAGMEVLVIRGYKKRKNAE
ncbi:MULTISPECIES: glycoside hydrolase family 3 C-terminal domain-containing protein [Blautia]|uniref:glycoside hydrolase family 3 C-terminal domain-containing protein n=1 Tax=Blautia TaxID=572511 RepID=UPI001D020ABA|nr:MULTISPECIES: glycoside hydrolase family 3 N-terminal domain-containing protein [Blautia]MCB5433042.1 glycoside hydrolase family 3 C-terminal domain-containing protein [Blautia faecis]MCB6328740.1 glycoside hydrolase family 3 C-terminal domain-containing protein [Blautia faecis]MCB6579830.1 glycoside hydrolase family 3 C-terminal domain-containing protein [Blautia faecis]MCB6624535.1 glycoside hydrolase family 3 C-terminal domain-containing protein [Blautia sp. 210702-DFI.1.159]MCB7291811.1